MARRFLPLAVLAGLVAALLAVGGPAWASCGQGDTSCQPSATSRQGRGTGQIGAGQLVTVTVRGGAFPSRQVAVTVPAEVLPPCFYTVLASGAQLATEAVDPKMRQLAHLTGENFSSWFPPDVAKYANTPGDWYSWECDSNSFGSDQTAFVAYVDNWVKTAQPFVWVPIGQAPPVPPVPPAILEGIARKALDQTVRMPLMHFSPAARTLVNLDTWMWVDPAAWQPITVTAAAAGVAVSVSATPATVSVGGLPAGSSSNTGCAGGGKPWTQGAGGTDCSIHFGQSSGAQPNQQWAFTTSLTWNVTSVGAPLIGPPTIVTIGNEALQVLETQVLNGGN